MTVVALMVGIAIILVAVLLKRIPEEGAPAADSEATPTSSRPSRPSLLGRKPAGPVADAAAALSSAKRVLVVPGYGLGVARAQRPLRELVDGLIATGVHVDYVVHPVAGRMPGHVNALLDEAEVPHSQVRALADLTPDDLAADVTLLVGANDIANPAAADPDSPLAGMPLLDTSRAGRVIALKRGTGRGHAGVDNPLLSAGTTTVLTGELAQTLSGLRAQLRQG